MQLERVHSRTAPGRHTGGATRGHGRPPAGNAQRRVAQCCAPTGRFASLEVPVQAALQLVRGGALHLIDRWQADSDMRRQQGAEQCLRPVGPLSRYRVSFYDDC